MFGSFGKRRRTDNQQHQFSEQLLSQEQEDLQALQNNPPQTNSLQNLQLPPPLPFPIFSTLEPKTCAQGSDSGPAVLIEGIRTLVNDKVLPSTHSLDPVDARRRVATERGESYEEVKFNWWTGDDWETAAKLFGVAIVLYSSDGTAKQLNPSSSAMICVLLPKDQSEPFRLLVPKQRQHSNAGAPSNPSDTPGSVISQNLKNFVQTMQTWRKAPDDKNNAKTFGIAAGQHILAHTLQNNADINSRAVMLIGNQSAGKTTLAMALTQQVAFLVDPGVGTKAKTQIHATFDPSIRETICKFTYKDTHREGLTVDALYNLYVSTFQNVNNNAVKIDQENMVSVEITDKNPNLGLLVVDHPGFVLQFVNETRFLSQDSVQRYFGNGKANGIMLVCHSALQDPSEGGWIGLNGLSQIPDEFFFVAVTRMDELSHHLVSQQVKKHGVTRISALGILRVIEKEFKQPYQGQPWIPQNAAVFFVASAAIGKEKFEGMSVEERWKTFSEGQLQNHKKMLLALTNEAAWQQHGITLTTMSNQEQQEFDNIVGVDKLLSALLKKQYEGVLDAAETVLQIVSAEKESVRRTYAELHKKKIDRQQVASVLLNFIEAYISEYHILANDQPYHSPHHDDFWDKLKTIFEKERKKLGWTLEEEQQWHAKLKKKGSFPPPDYRIDDFNSFMREIKVYARPADEKLCSLQHLLRRFQEEYAFLTCGIKIPEVTAQELLPKAQNAAALQITELKNGLAVHVATEYSKIYSSTSDGGNLFTATRAAQCFLMHAQTVFTLLAKIPEFSSMVKTTDDDSMSSFLLRNVNAVSRVQKGSPTNNGDRKMAKFCAAYSSASAHQTSTLAVLLKKQSPTAPRSIRTDLGYALIAMFFDAPFTGITKELEKLTNMLAETQPSFIAASLHFAPLFIHQNSDFLKEVAQRNPGSDYTKAFLAGIDEPLSLDQKLDPSVLSKIGQQITPNHINGPKENLVTSVFQFGREALKRKRTEMVPEHIYADPNGALFRKLDETTKQIAQVNHRLKSPTHLEQAHLLSSLIRMQDCPDVVVGTQSSSDAAKYENDSVNYVCKRNISAGIFGSLHGVLRTLASFAYPYYHQAKTLDHTRELTERLLSMLLGYGYGFLEEERPLDSRNLNIHLLIPFLYRNKEAIVNQTENHTILKAEEGYINSPLVQHILNLAAKGKIGNVIDNLYSHWNALMEADSSLSPQLGHNLNCYLIELLATESYSQKELVENHRRQLDSYQALHNQITNMEGELQSYIKFLQQHGHLLSSYGQERKLKKLRPEPVVTDTQTSLDEVAQSLLDGAVVTTEIH